MIYSHNTFLKRLMDRIFIYLMFHETIDGLWVGILDDKKAAEVALSDIRQALALIREHDSYRYHRVISRLDKVLVVPSHNQGEYVRALRRCILATAMVKERNIGRIAGLLIHEATHAELFDRGIAYGNLASRKRVEDFCSREQLVFGRKIALNERLLEDAEFRLQLPAGAFSGEVSFRRELDWFERDSGMPKWLVRGMIKLRGLR